MPAVNDIFAALLADRINVAEAIARATAPGVADAVPEDMLAFYAETIQKASYSNWRSAVKGIRVVLAMLQARPADKCSLLLRATVVAAQIEVVSLACSDVPDGRLFYPAVTAGESVAREAEAAPSDLAGEVLQRLGALHIDPWVMGGGEVDKQRLYEEYGSQLAGIPAEQLDLPSPLKALTAATNYFRRALPYRHGLDRVRTLKALVQSGINGEKLGRVIDRAEIGERLDEAFGLFQEDDDPGLFADLLLFAAKLGRPAPEGKGEALSQKLFAEALEDTVKRLGFGLALQQYSAIIGWETTQRPIVALQLWVKMGPLMGGVNSPLTRADHLRLGLKLIRAVFGKPGVEPRTANVIELANKVLADLAQGKTDAERAAGALVAIASIAPYSNSERAGLQILEAARKTGPGWIEIFPQAVLYLEAALHEGLGVNAYDNHQFGEAVAEYISAARQFSDIGLMSTALTDLGNVADLISKGDPDALNNTVASLTAHVTAIQAGTGTAGVEELRRIFNATMQKVAASGRINVPLVTFLWGIVKGAAFSTAMAEPPAWRWHEDEQALDLLRQVNEAEAEVTGVSQPSGIDEDELLVAYASPGEVSSGADPAAVLENTQHAFDTFVNARLLAAAANHGPLLLTDAQLQATLDERTVLVNQLLAPSPNGMAAVYTIIATREEVTVTCGSLQVPFGKVMFEGKDGKKVEGDYFTLPVGAVRKAVINNDEAGMKELTSDVGLYLGGGLLNQLGELRKAGKDHLCFAPHGPIHYYPLHLLGPEGAPLAADWKVTSLPSMSILARAPIANRRAEELRVFGVNWPDLDNAGTEATAIAEQFGIAAELDAAATKEAFLGALSSARMVHVATHGFHNVAAPSFQSIRMSDGILKAYELIGLDLRGCELVTLSACETALGRFDPLGNIRGLPAVLFMAGAETIIGTLWKVESHCAQYFFSLLYERLRAGDTKLDAFAAAQASAREYYPEYRDWGAFYYAGRW